MNGRAQFRLWRAQLAAIMRLELGKTVRGRRAIPVWLLALSPVALFGLHALAVERGWTNCRGQEDLLMYAAMFQVYYLRLAIFFGCVGLFLNLFRGEIVEKTLHYYLLAPVRRDVLAVGKYLSGVLAGVTLFSGGAAASYLILRQHVASLRNWDFAAAPPMGDLAVYLGVTLLAVAGYGAVFLLLGLFCRNPMVPAALVLIWESVNLFLPPLLKRLSVIYYLESLCPVRIPGRGGRVFAMVADPPSTAAALAGVLGLSLALLALSALRLRRIEISYGTE